MPAMDLLLFLAVLACAWVHVAARKAAASTDVKQRARLALPLALALLLSAAGLHSEWVIRDVAGAAYVEPQAALAAARAAPGPMAVESAYTVGTVESAFRRQRDTSFTLALAALGCLATGWWSGRRARGALQPARA